MTFVDLRDIFNFVFDSVNNALRVNVVAGSGGGGGAVTVADGADVALGTTTDPAAIGDVNGTAIAHLRGISEQIEEVTTGTNLNITGAVSVSNFPATQPVSGTVTVSNFPATQPVSGTVTANQGAQAASGGLAGSWFVQGPTGVGGPIAARPFQMAGENSGNVALLHISSIGSVIADQGIQGAGGTTSWQVQGAAANQTAVAGNPQWIGAGTTAAGGNVQGLQVESAANPSLRTSIWFAGSQAAVINPGDSVASGNFGLVTASVGLLWDAALSCWIRARSDIDATLLASASRTTTQTSADITTYNLGALAVYLNVTVNGAGGSITLTVNEKDPASGVYVNLLTGLAVTGTGMNRYRIDPRCPDVANRDVQAALPRVFQVVVTANNANAVTYSVGYTLKVV